jgi:co-chaperonin GroES (HSP10)
MYSTKVTAMIAIRPCGHKILVAPLEWEKETEWGFALTPTENSETARLEKAGRMYGTLVAVGPQAWKAHAASIAKGGLCKDRDPILSDWAQIGDTVMYSRYAGKNVYDPNDGTEFYLINDEDVLAVLPPKEEWVWNPAEKGEKI